MRDSSRQSVFSILISTLAAGTVVLPFMLFWWHSCPDEVSLPSPSINMAAMFGETEAVIRFLNAGADVNALNSEGRTPLYLAAREGRVETARLLQSRGARSSMLIAAGLGDLQAVRDYVEKGEDVNKRERHSGTPLNWAAKNGHLAVVRYLLRHNADISARDAYYSGQTPIHLAAQEGHLDVIRFLLSASANANARDDGAKTPLHRAASYCRIPVIKCLIEHGADPNAKDGNGDTPLHIAVHGIGPKDICEQTARALVEGGSDPNIRCKYGYSPLYKAVRAGDSSMARMFISHGGKVDLFVASGMGYVGRARKLLRAGSQIDAQDGLGYTALHWAARAGREKIAEMLLAGGASPNIGNCYRITPLHLALWSAEDPWKGSVIDRLIEAPHHERYLRVARQLVLAGADVDTRDTLVRATPLEFATDKGYGDLVALMRQESRKQD